jgi:hypothetical protein
MTPFEQAVAVYSREPCARTFDEDLRLHLRNGYVVSTPDFFVMARPVRRIIIEGICNPAIRFEKPDCWHVYLLAGSIQKALTALPYDLPWMSWERGNVLRFYPLASIRRRIQSTDAPSPSVLSAPLLP